MLGKAVGQKVNYGMLFSRNPISDYPFYVLVETHGSDETHDEEKLSRFLNNEMESGLILDGTVSSEPNKMQVKPSTLFTRRYRS